jgi:hypothetical protein
VHSDFVAHLRRLNLYGEAYIEQARQALVSAVHSGLLLTVMVAMLALVWVYRVPLIRLTRSTGASKETRHE